VIEVIGGGVKLPTEKLVALNKLLELWGGTFQGRPQFKLSWAADDNLGLAKDHVCGKTDPFDTACHCLPKSKQIPVCFHPEQYSYHLLSFHENINTPSDLISTFSKQEDTRFRYDCLKHYLDPVTGKPINPTATIIENDIPVLMNSAKAMLAARFQMDATFRQECRQRAQKRREARALAELRNDQFARDLINEVVPAWNPHTGCGPKRRQFADLTASDVVAGKVQFGKP